MKHHKKRALGARTDLATVSLDGVVALRSIELADSAVASCIDFFFAPGEGDHS